MTTPIWPPANTSGVGLGGSNLLNQYGINVSGGAVTSSSATGQLGGGQRVWMGGKPSTPSEISKEKKLAGVGPGATYEEGEDYNSVIGLPAIWAREDPKKLQEFVNKGISHKIPGFDVDMGMPEIMDAWKRIVDSSVEISKGTGAKWSPWDIIDSYSKPGAFGTTRKGDFIYDVGTGKPVKYVGPTSKTKTSKQVNLSSPEEVRALAIQSLREALGRNPTDNEVAQFRASINALEQRNPEVTTQTVQLRPNLATGEVEEVSSSSTTSGGVGQAEAQGLISSQVEKSPEYAKFQGANYFNDLLAMLGGG